MTTIESRRRLRPVYATRPVIEKARRAGFGVVEERIIEAILDGRVSSRCPPGIPTLVPGQQLAFLDSQTAVVLSTTPSTLNPHRKTWLATRLYTRVNGPSTRAGGRT